MGIQFTINAKRQQNITTCDPITGITSAHFVLHW